MRGPLVARVAAALFVAVVVAAAPRPAHAAGCEDFVPDGCKRMKAGDRLPAVVQNQCFVFDESSTGGNAYESINVLAGGGIYFVDPGFDDATKLPRTLGFKVSALLIEKGGVVQAGSPGCPIGKAGGKLAIGIYGDDPTKQGTVTPPASKAGIQCLTNKAAAKPELRCFPSDAYAKGHYCTEKDSDDPCSSTTAPGDEPLNKLLEPYGNLNFDDNPWGYKVIGVSYGGTLAMYGYRGVKPLQDANWAAANDPADHCPVPSVSTLDLAEMQAWSDLTGNSWARLAGVIDDKGRQITTLTLDRNVAVDGRADWQVGDEIVIGSTDWYPNHSEQRTISKITPLATGTQIEVELLKFPHNASLFSAGTQADFSNPVTRTAVDTRAVVGLLSRSISVYSLGPTGGEFPKTRDCTADKNANPDCYFGGHLIARQGFKQVAIQGVEFKWLGQGGRMGHYPVHFHLAKSTQYTNGKKVKGTFVKDSSVWDSMTRFIVIHGTHEVTLARNVGYLSLGHGYFIEDASEIRNRLCHNLGVGARAALQQYVTEQQKMEHWCGGEPPPAARVVPPILDGSAFDAGDPRPMSATGSDTYMPTMYWMMNAYNEFVGNAAVSVHGFGSCFWLLGSAVSGASVTHQFDGFAGYNSPGYQAPLLRFRGNSCVSSPLALPASREITPGSQGPAGNELKAALDTGFTALANPYLSNGAKVAGNYVRPLIRGNFLPMLNGKQMSCATGAPSSTILDNNTKSCVTTILDRFSTSYNWAEVNFASVWLRPLYYLFSNSAVTDQLFGGLGIVTGGDWQQAPPAYLALAQNNLFVGTTQTAGDATNLYARRSGPRFTVTDKDDLGAYALCPSGKTTCNFAAAGTGYWRGAYQPKRMITIYDGPTYADGNAFLNVGAWECNAQPCAGASSASGCTTKVNGEAELGCGIYSSTFQPVGPKGGTNIAVIDAAIGWKQPNGFYYPPAFDYRRNAFLKNRSDAFNMCLTAAPGDYQNLKFQPGSCRHNVLDRTQVYQAGNMEALREKNLAVQSGPNNKLDAGTIDFATILLDLDGSLTGSTSVIDGRANPGLTTSVSRNIFYDAPSQSPECLAYGVQTSPYTFISSVMGELRDSPKTEANAILRGGGNWSASPAVAIYRQWKLKEDEVRESTDECTQVCAGENYGCKRASFMGMASLYQPSYLTMTQPPALPRAQTGALYYIDTNSGQQSLSCIRGSASFTPAVFQGERSYVLYNLFAQRDSKTSYQIYVGDVKELTDIELRFVRVFVHETDPANAALQRVEKPCDPRQPNQWCSAMLPGKPVKGVLTVTLDHAKLPADVFTAAKRADYDRCMPRDLCYYDDQDKKCKRCDSSAAVGATSRCLRAGDFVGDDVRSMNATDKNGRKPLDAVCEEWSSMISGQIKINNGASVTSSDCPAGGCLGVAFKLPKGFQPQLYQKVNGGQGGRPLSRCFIESAWMKDKLDERSGDPQCGAPRAQKSTDFCADPTIDLPADADTVIDAEQPAENAGEASSLMVADGEPARSLVAFDGDAIESFLAQQPLTRATLELTTQAPVEGEDVMVDAHPLLQGFAEGDPQEPETGELDEGAAEAAPTAVRPARTSGLIAAGRGAPPPLPSIPGRSGLPTLPGSGTPGATWECATDLDTENGQVNDCAVRWQTPGGDYAAATAPPVLAQGGAGTVLRWDVTADVMAGVSSWLLKLRDEDAAGEVTFHSEEGALRIGDPALGPVLVLE